MLSLTGYTVNEKIYESVKIRVYRGVREDNNVPVVIKLLKNAYPTPHDLETFSREYEILGEIRNIHGVIKAYDLLNYGNTSCIVLEDFGGAPLSLVWMSGMITTRKMLSLFIQISEVIGCIHDAGIIHMCINPSNILVNPQTFEIKIIDFSYAAKMIQVVSTQLHSDTYMLPYISPEQTGRMNRPIDFRTDFYSLGVTFYESLTGQLPFKSKDIMELLHCHLAKSPDPPLRVNADINEVVSDIVMRLMAKNPEDRYQSAVGIKADLENCIAQLESKGEIEPFELAKMDSTNRFKLPAEIFGRETELTLLQNAYERISEGDSEIVIVYGYPGVGKTSLIDEVCPAIVAKGAYFIRGKFNQSQQQAPYESLIQAFSALIYQLLAESQESIAEWKNQLVEALGKNAQVIVDVFPELELIIGTPPQAPAVSADDAQNRLNFMFEKFIKVFANKEHPVVLFLDDLQWADAASLNIMKLFLKNSDIRYILIYGTYRSDEVGDDHLLKLTLEDIRQSGVLFSDIHLLPLGKKHISQIICKALNWNESLAFPLTSVVFIKTSGNPFFIHQFLYKLYQEKFIQYDRKSGQWHCDIYRIYTLNISDNVTDLMIEKLRRFSQQTIDVLSLAACFGNFFEVGIISRLQEHSSDFVIKALEPAIIEGMILPADESNILFYPKKWSEQSAVNPIVYRFLKNEVQQAVYMLIEEERRKMLHLNIGRLLWKMFDPQKRDDWLFEIVRHFNEASSIINDGDERHMIAELNLTAGQKAKISAAYQSALAYFLKSIDLVKENGWENQYDFMFTAYLEALETTLLVGEDGKVQGLADSMLQHSKEILDKVKVYEVFIKTHVKRINLDDAIQTSLLTLKLLGNRLPVKPKKWHVFLDLLRTKVVLKNMTRKDLLELPKSDDVYWHAEISIGNRLSNAAYLNSPLLLPLLISSYLRKTLKKGVAPGTAINYAGYGVLMIGIMNNIEEGQLFGEIALEILDRDTTESMKAKTLLVVNLLINPWCKEMTKVIDACDKIYNIGLETGDFESAANTLGLYGYYAFFAGHDLKLLEAEMKENSKRLQQRNYAADVVWNEIVRATILSLIHPSTDLFERIDNVVAGSRFLSEGNKNFDRNITFCLSLNKLILCCIYEKYAFAQDFIEKAYQYIESVMGQYHIAVFYFYSALVSLSSVSGASKKERSKKMAYVRKVIRKFQKWSQHCPSTYQHKLYLIEAEKARAMHQNDLAGKYYTKAINGARESKFINEEALANEMAARFYLNNEQETIAVLYLREAQHLYKEWGAEAKVRYLNQKYKRIFMETSHDIPSDNQLVSQARTTETGYMLDLEFIIQSSRALSGEIQLSQLLEKIVRFSIESSGANRAMLVLKEEYDQELRIEAEAEVGNKISVLEGLPVVESDRISAEVVNYVIKTRQHVILNDPAKDDVFANDPYIIDNRPKSILCVPVVSKRKMSGILYLENTLMYNAFSKKRLELLQILASQAAISIENAKFYDTIIHNQAELEKSEEHYRKMLQTIQDGYFEIDLRGNFTFVNDAMLTIFQRSRQELLGTNSQVYMDEANAKKAYRLYIEAYQTEIPITGFEHEIIRKDNTRRVINGAASFIKGSNGKIKGFRGIARDITHKKVANKVRIQAEINSALAHVHEEITPAINSIAELAHELENKIQINEQKKCVSAIVYEAKQLLAIAANLKKNRGEDTKTMP